MVHTTQELETFNLLLITSVILGKEVEVFKLDQLSGDFESNLITPSVDERHGDIIKEDSHFLLTGWSVGSDLLSLDHGTDRLLEGIGGGGTGEVHSVEEHLVGVEFAAVHHDDGGLGSTWSSYEEGVVVSWLISLLGSHDWELGDLLDDILGSGGISSWDEELRESDSLGRVPHLSGPDGPLESGLTNVVVVNSLVVNLNLLWADWWERCVL